MVSRASVVAFLKEKWHRNEYWFVASWIFSGWLTVDWASSMGMTPILHVQEGFVLVLTLILPFWPSAIGIILVATCFALTYLPIPSTGAYWLMTSPIMLALVALGERYGGIIGSTIAAIFLETVVIISQTMGNDALVSYAATYLPLSVAWDVGALIRKIALAEQAKARSEQQAEERRRQLDTVHVLHDSIANTMSYALMRCRVAEDGTSPTALCEAESALELALRQLRSEVITPMRQQIEQSSELAAASSALPSSGSNTSPLVAHDGELAVRVALNNIAQRLDRLGFSGAPTYSDPSGIELSEPMTRMLCQIVEEIGANIMKHGVPGDYALAVIIRSNDGVTIVSSNQCAADEKDAAAIECTGHGLRLLRDTVMLCGGTVQTYVEDGEWVVSVRIAGLR